MFKLPVQTIISIFGVLLFLSGTAVPGGAEENDTLKILDNLYARRSESPENIHRMIEIIEEKLASRSGDYELLWRAAQGYLFLGDHAGDSEERLHLYEKGKEYAEQATTVNEDGYEGFYLLGVLLGSTGLERGVMNSLFMVRPMKNALERCLEIDPENPRAYNPLAQLYWQAPGWPLSIGNINTALELAEKLVTLAPNSVYNWYIYGNIALEAKNPELAKEALQKCVSLPEDPKNPEDDRNFKKSAQKLLLEL